MSTPSILTVKENDWLTRVRAQQDAMTLGEYQRFGRLDALCFEITRLSNPKMLILGQQRTPDGRMAWPGKNLDWLNHGPVIAFSKVSGELLLPSRPFPLPPDAPDPAWVYSEATPEPARIPQRIEDRAMRIKGTAFICIQPVSQINWMLDLAASGRARREVHKVIADGAGIHMAFIYDTQAHTGHLVGGQVI